MLLKQRTQMDLQSTILIASIGIVAGILGGMLGLGGAIIIIPALVMILGYSQQMAQGTALIMMVLPVGALAAFQYYQKGFVDVKASLIMAALLFYWWLFGRPIRHTNSSGYSKKSVCNDAGLYRSKNVASEIAKSGRK